MCKGTQLRVVLQDGHLQLIEVDLLLLPRQLSLLGHVIECDEFELWAATEALLEVEVVALEIHHRRSLDSHQVRVDLIEGGLEANSILLTHGHCGQEPLAGLLSVLGSLLLLQLLLVGHHQTLLNGLVHHLAGLDGQHLIQALQRAELRLDRDVHQSDAQGGSARAADLDTNLRGLPGRLVVHVDHT